MLSLLVAGLSWERTICHSPHDLEAAYGVFVPCRAKVDESEWHHDEAAAIERPGRSVTGIVHTGAGKVRMGWLRRFRTRSDQRWVTEQERESPGYSEYPGVSGSQADK